MRGCRKSTLHSPSFLPFLSPSKSLKFPPQFLPSPKLPIPLLLLRPHCFIEIPHHIRSRKPNQDQNWIGLNWLVAEEEMTNLMYVSAEASADLNKNTSWFAYPGVWTTYILLLLVPWLLLVSLIGCSPGAAWTVVHLLHFLVRIYVLLDFICLPFIYSLSLLWCLRICCWMILAVAAVCQ